MRLPSLLYLWQKAKEGLQNFPFTILAALAASAVSIFLVENGDDLENVFPYLNFLLSAALGIPLFFSLSILARHYNFDPVLKYAVYAAGFVFLLIIFISLPGQESTHNTSIPYIRYAIFNIAIHLFVAFVPFLKSRQLNGFWNYNKLLFLRILESLVYSGFLYVGLVLAMLSLHLLFDVDIEEETYFELYILIQGVFNTWFFVSGIPSDLHNQDEIQIYPKGLKIFTQYILMPLLVLYLIILYAYGLKIVIAWDWPEGIVSYMITCVAALGILNLLLIYPYGKSEEANAWIQRFSKMYYYALVPLVVLLFIAIGMRISDYGLTINRYLIVLMGIWLSVICLYFILGFENIKVIPISLAAILLICSFGPWGIFSWSERSQVSRLTYYLEVHGILKNGKIQNEVIWEQDSLPEFCSKNKETNDHLMPDSIHNEVVSIMNYLDDNHGMKAIQGWYSQNLDSLLLAHEKEYKYGSSESQLYLESAGLESSTRYAASYIYLEYGLDKTEIIDIKEYDHLIRRSEPFYRGSPNAKKYQSGDQEIEIRLTKGENKELQIGFQGQTFEISLEQKVEELQSLYGKQAYKVDLEHMQLSDSIENLSYQLIINELRLNGQEEKLEISYLDFILLWKEI